MFLELTGYNRPQAFTIMDQNRDGFIDKNDLRDTFAAVGKCSSVFLIAQCSTLYTYFPAHFLGLMFGQFQTFTL